MQLSELEYPLVVIGVDPGGTTGVSVYYVKDEETPAALLEQMQWGDWTIVCDQLIELGGRHRKIVDTVVFVIEQFDKRPGIADPDFTPMFIIKDIDRYMPTETIVWQTPSQAKNLVKPAHRGTSDGLKRFGWYKVGMGHANDASRHVIVFLVEKLHHMPTITKGWPRRGDS